MIGTVMTIGGIAGYRAKFAKAFGSGAIDIDRVTMAIACFERTVLSGNAPFDRYKRGDKSALSDEQVRGMAVFFDKASCDRCHQGANFTSNAYANEGIGTDKLDPDVGRFAVTHQARDWGAFKIPTLREVEHTAPYMHDGSLKTLEEVVEFYNRGGIPNPHLDANIRPLHLTAAYRQATPQRCGWNSPFRLRQSLPDARETWPSEFCRRPVVPAEKPGPAPRRPRTPRNPEK